MSDVDEPYAPPSGQHMPIEGKAVARPRGWLDLDFRGTALRAEREDGRPTPRSLTLPLLWGSGLRAVVECGVWLARGPISGSGRLIRMRCCWCRHRKMTGFPSRGCRGSSPICRVGTVSAQVLYAVCEGEGPAARDPPLMVRVLLYG